eukprot:317394_1
MIDNSNYTISTIIFITNAPTHHNVPDNNVINDIVDITPQTNIANVKYDIAFNNSTNAGASNCVNNVAFEDPTNDIDHMSHIQLMIFSFSKVRRHYAMVRNGKR